MPGMDAPQSLEGRIVQVLPQSNNKQAELLITSLDLSRPLDSLLDPFVAAWPLATCYLLPQYLRSFYLPFHCDTLYVSCFYSLRHCTDWRQYRVDNTWKQSPGPGYFAKHGMDDASSLQMVPRASTCVDDCLEHLGKVAS